MQETQSNCVPSSAVKAISPDNISTGTFIGVGVGPGDPELMTLKAFRLISQADVLCFLVDSQGKSHAKSIAAEAIAANNLAVQYIPILMPMNKDRRLANQHYDQASDAIQSQLALGKNVVFLCEGDPLFFGSYSYLLERIEDHFLCQVVPGISSVNAAASALVQPLTRLTDAFAVVSGRHSAEFLRSTLRQYDSVVIMKAGQARGRIIQALADTKRSQDASYLAYIGREQEVIEHDISQLSSDAGPYFSLFVVCKKERTCR